MTDKTQPEALMQLADAYAEASFDQGLHKRTLDDAPENARSVLAAAVRRQHARIAELEAALFAYASEFEPNGDGDPDVGSIHKNIRAMKAKLASIEDGMQALSAAPAVQHEPTNEMYRAAQKIALPYDDDGGTIILNTSQIRAIWQAMLAASPPAEQQAAPKAAQVKACVCGEPQASGTVHRVDGPCYVAAPQQEAQEPMAIKAMGYGGSTGINDYLMSDGTIKAMRPSEVVWAAPQPAPAPLSDDTKRLREALQRIEGASMSMYATRSDMLEHCQDIARAALAAQGCTP